MIPDAFLALDYMLDRFTWLVDGLVVRPERMRRNLEASHYLFFSQRVLNALVEAGLARDDAYRLVQRAAMRAWEEELDFRELCRADDEIASRVDLDADVRPRRIHAPRRHRFRPSRSHSRRNRYMPEPSTRVREGPRDLRPIDDDDRCSSSRPTASRRSTSSCRPRSPTRAASSPASPATGSRCSLRSSRTTCSRSATTAGRWSAAGSRCCRSSASSAAISPARAGRTTSASGEVCGHALPEGLRESDKLPEPIFTPATKANEGHDENITREQAAELVGEERFREVEEASLRLYTTAAEHALRAGIIIADTKFEMGIDADGNARARRRGADARLVPLLARRHVRARARAGQLRQAVRPRLLRDDRLGQDRPRPGNAGRRRRR